MQIGVDTQRAVENKKALVIDNDDVSAMALQFMLADELEVNVVTTSAQALASIRPGSLDVILLGSSVLESEGSNVVGRLLETFPQVPVVVFGPVGDEHVAAALLMGARSAIVRPFKLEAVRQRVNAQIGRRAVLTIPVVRGN